MTRTATALLTLALSSCPTATDGPAEALPIAARMEDGVQTAESVAAEG